MWASVRVLLEPITKPRRAAVSVVVVLVRRMLLIVENGVWTEPITKVDVGEGNETPDPARCTRKERERGRRGGSNHQSANRNRNRLPTEGRANVAALSNFSPPLIESQQRLPQAY